MNPNRRAGSSRPLGPRPDVKAPPVTQIMSTLDVRRAVTGKYGPSQLARKLNPKFRIFHVPDRPNRSAMWVWECTFCDPPARGARKGTYDSWRNLIWGGIRHHFRVRNGHHGVVARKRSIAAGTTWHGQASTDPRVRLSGDDTQRG